MLTPNQLLDKAEQHLRAARLAADAITKKVELDQAKSCHQMFDDLVRKPAPELDVEVAVERLPPSYDPFAVDRAISLFAFRWR